ncbi:glycosyltransferase [Vibrio pomeroyi]|uniref:glycosyltransferase n=1 Tax=Vibrio pomeroyi TaxID=198832 RepID=UPI0021C475B6|nr:glycosyltransferase [Vibrio pomeroyi]
MKDFPVGGIEEVFINLSSGFKNKNYSIDLLILSEKKVDRDYLNNNYNNFSNVYYGFKSAFKLRGKKYDIAISAKEKANLFLTLMKVFGFYIAKVVVTRHVSVDPEVSKNEVSWYTKYLYKMYSKAGCKIVACSKALTQEISSAFGVKTCCIYNPIVSPRFFSKVQVSKYGYEYIIEGKKTWYLSVEYQNKKV